MGVANGISDHGCACFAGEFFRNGGLEYLSHCREPYAVRIIYEYILAPTFDFMIVNGFPDEYIYITGYVANQNEPDNITIGNAETS